MKRDMDLIRQILLRLEEHEHGHAPSTLIVEGYSEEQIGYHAYLMGQAGLLNVVDATNMGSTSPQAIPTRMTWHGHEFLDAARSETIWQRAKARLGTDLTSVSFDALKSLLLQYVRENIGL